MSMVEVQWEQLEVQIAELERILGLDPETNVVDLEQAVQTYQELPTPMRAEVVVKHDAILALADNLLQARIISENQECTGLTVNIFQRLPRLNAAVLCGIRQNPSLSLIDE